MVVDVEAFLARADDVLIDWEGSDDAATWAADGEHEHDIYPYAYLAPDSTPILSGYMAGYVVVDEEFFAAAEVFRQLFDETVARLEFSLCWRDEAMWWSSSRAPKLSPDASTEATAERWLATWQQRGDGRGSLEPVAGCLPPLVARDDAVRVRFAGPRQERRKVPPTAGPTPPPIRRQ